MNSLKFGFVLVHKVVVCELLRPPGKGNSKFEVVIVVDSCWVCKRGGLGTRPVCALLCWSCPADVVVSPCLSRVVVAP